MSNTQDVVRILSIDGGGIRGILPLSILKYIEEKTQTPIHQLFNVIGGTSTGGIIALGLNSKNPETNEIYSAQDIFDFYVKDAKNIFKLNDDSYSEEVMSWVRDKIVSQLPVFKELAGKNGAGVLSPQYSGKNIEDFLKKKFGDDKMSDLSNQCDVDVTVYSYDIENDETFRFNNKEAATNHYYVWQAARATSAAPTFFSGLEVFNSNSKVRFGIAEYSSPALAVHLDKLYMAWRGAGKGDDKIYYASFDGKNWSDQNRAAEFVITKNSSPALAVHQGQLYLTWRGEDEGIYYASFDGKSWSNQNRAGKFGISKNSSPALAVHQEKLYMAWRGAGKGFDKIYYASFDGENWSDHNRASTFEISEDSSPALAVHQNKLYVTWRSKDKSIYYASFDGKSWSDQNRAAEFVITKNSSPALAVHQGQLYLTWRGEDEGIYYASFDGQNWSRQNRAGMFEISEDGSPTLAVHQEKLYMAWRGAGKGDDKIYCANFDVTNWSMRKRVPNFKTLVDGGIFINNPAMDLFIRAKKLYPNAKKIVLVSLGTGNFLESHPDLQKGGLVSWLRPLIAYMMKGVSITVDEHLKNLLGNSPDSIKNSLNEETSYYRFELDFDENIAMDAIEGQDIKRLQELGNKLVKDKKKDIDELIESLNKLKPK